MKKKSERFKLIASGYLLLIKNKKILLARRCNTGYEDGKYGVPSGHLEPNETIRQCCAREILEEIGITVHPEDLTLVHIMHRKGNDERIDYFFAATEWLSDIVNKEPDKCDDLQWFSLNNLPENIIPYIKFAIEQYLNGSIYSEFGWIK